MQNKTKFTFLSKAITGIVTALVVVFVLPVLTVLFSTITVIGASSSLGPVVLASSNDNLQLSEEEKQELEEKRKKAAKEAEKKQEKLDKLKKEKKKKEAVKEKYLNEAGAIKSTLNSILGNISALEKKVARTQEELDKINEDIKKQEEEIDNHKKNLATIIRRINKKNIELQLIMLNDKRSMDEYIRNEDLLQELQKKILKEMDELKEKKRELNEQKKKASEAREVLIDQKKTLDKEKVRKSWEYSGAQKKVSEQEAEIREIEKEMAALQSTISALLGKSYNTNDIKAAAGYASKVTGVRKAFILGMLTVETNLGRYTGGCNYKTSRMSSYRKKLFKQIAKETGHNYKKMKVSCPPRGYKGTGGAMGVAQFMSDTWMGYRSKIAAVTGHKHPDPWNLTDGVVAMALKLANDGAKSKKGECRAAMRYLGGSHHWYCDKVLRYAKQYEK